LSQDILDLVWEFSVPRLKMCIYGILSLSKKEIQSSK